MSRMQRWLVWTAVAGSVGLTPGIAVQTSQAAGVRINEVLFEPTGPDSSAQWVELCNRGAEAQDIAGWRLGNADLGTLVPLPNVQIPAGAYLVVRFQEGTSEYDWSDGEGLHSTGTTAPAFRAPRDGCVLYSGEPSALTIVDFTAWSSDGQPPAGPAMQHAVDAGQWPPGGAVDVSLGGAFVAPWTAGAGETVGRDSLSADTDLPADFRDHGGAHALAETEGRCNNGPAFLPVDLILIAQSSVNQFLWEFALNTEGASHANATYGQTSNLATADATHTFQVRSRVDGGAATLSGPIQCRWERTGPTAWSLTMQGELGGNRGQEHLSFTADLSDSSSANGVHGRVERIAHLVYTTPLGFPVSHDVNISCPDSWIDDHTRETLDRREVQDSRGLLHWVRQGLSRQVFTGDAEEQVQVEVQTDYLFPPAEPPERFRLVADKTFRASGAMQGLVHEWTTEVAGCALGLEQVPTHIAWTNAGPDSVEFTHEFALGNADIGYRDVSLRGTYGAVFEQGEFLVRGHASVSVDGAEPVILSYYADRPWWKKVARVVAAAAWGGACAGGAVAASPSIVGSVAVGALCAGGAMATDIAINGKRSGGDDIPPPLFDLPRTICVGAGTQDDAGALTLSLEEIHPNPASRWVDLRYTLPCAGMVVIAVYDPAGRRVADLLRAWQPAGSRRLRRLAEADGRSFPSGVLLFRLDACGGSASRRVVLLK